MQRSPAFLYHSALQKLAARENIIPLHINIIIFLKYEKCEEEGGGEAPFRNQKNPWKKFDRIEFNRKVRKLSSGSLHTSRGKMKRGIKQERKAKKIVKTGPGDPIFQ